MTLPNPNVNGVSAGDELSANNLNKGLGDLIENDEYLEGVMDDAGIVGSGSYVASRFLSFRIPSVDFSSIVESTQNGHCEIAVWESWDDYIEDSLAHIPTGNAVITGQSSDGSVGSNGWSYLDPPTLYELPDKIDYPSAGVDMSTTVGQYVIYEDLTGALKSVGPTAIIAFRFISASGVSDWATQWIVSELRHWQLDSGSSVVEPEDAPQTMKLAGPHGFTVPTSDEGDALSMEIRAYCSISDLNADAIADPPFTAAVSAVNHSGGGLRTVGEANPFEIIETSDGGTNVWVWTGTRFEQFPASGVPPTYAGNAGFINLANTGGINSGYVLIMVKWTGSSGEAAWLPLIR